MFPSPVTVWCGSGGFPGKFISKILLRNPNSFWHVMLPSWTQECRKYRAGVYYLARSGKDSHSTDQNLIKKVQTLFKWSLDLWVFPCAHFELLRLVKSIQAPLRESGKFYSVITLLGPAVLARNKEILLKVRNLDCAFVFGIWQSWVLVLVKLSFTPYDIGKFLKW